MLHRIIIQLLLSYSIFFFVAASFQFFSFSATSCVAFLVKTVLHLQFVTQMYSFTLNLIFPMNIFQWLSSLTSKLSSRLNAYSEFRISRSYSVKYNFLWAEFSPKTACWALCSRSFRRSLSSEYNSLWVWREGLLILFRRFYLDIDSATLITEPSLSSLSLCLATVSRCMLSLLSPGETCETEASNIVETPNSPVFSRVIFEKSEMLS